MSCKTCKFLVVEPNKAGHRVVRSDSAYRCSCPDPALPKLPACMTSAYGFYWPPRRAWVFASCGKDCPMYEALA